MRKMIFLAPEHLKMVKNQPKNVVIWGERVQMYKLLAPNVNSMVKFMVQRGHRQHKDIVVLSVNIRKKQPLRMTEIIFDFFSNDPCIIQKDDSSLHRI
jgi:hypothetical protein